MRYIPLERLRRVWNHPRWTVEECAAILKISEEEIRQLAKLNRLRHRRRIPSAGKYGVDEEPTPEQAAEWKQRAAEVRQRHLEQRMAEPVSSTVSKVSKWRAGICSPREGSHIV